ncbi:MAG: SusC/RagA family TonB-linked outer membrane protein, partial [Bacteroidota bacterium]
MYKRLTHTLFWVLTGLTSLNAQAQRVTGKVVDFTNEPLPGVNVIERGTTNGTLTDVEGNYALTVSSDTAILIFSYVGFNREEEPVDNRSTINVTLIEDITSLSEVVVIGYGTQQKENVSGAISTVDAEAIEGRPVADVESALQGQIAGLQITSNSGSPGAGNSVRIRGTSSITGGSSPLYVIDGNIISTGVGGGGNPLATINPADIASVNVLKDASAAAIYGARAANGVIIVTTKRGTAGEPKINVNVFGGVQSATNTLDLLNAQQYQQVRNQVADNAGVPRIPNLDGTTLTTSTDWQDAVLQTSAIQSYEVSASGGGTNTTYYTSLRHYDEEGIILGTGMRRTSLRINTDTQLGRFKLGNSLNVSRTNFDREFFANGRGTLHSAISNSPAIAIRNPDNIGGYNGPTNDDGDTGVLNPVAAQDLIDRESFVNRILGNMFAEYELIEGLNYRINFGVDLSSYQNQLFAPFFDLGTGDAVVGLPNGAEIREGRGDNVSLLLENTLNFRRTFGKHNLDLLVGYTVQDDQRQEIEVQTVGQNISEGFPVISASTDQVVPPSGFLVEERTVSYIGRVLYDYDSRYLATFNFRRDGSSIFTRENFFDNFFSGSLGWVISNEAFMDNSIFSNLKLRASYGFLGNDQINPNATNSILNTNARYVFGNEQVVLNTFAPGGRIANPGLVWEKQEQLNIGLDIGLLDNKLSATVDYYVKNSNDLLLSFP